jgi:uncharacterized protein (DUF924 family)
LESSAADVLDFWFAGARDDAAHVRARIDVWFGVHAEFDRACREHWTDLLEVALRGELDLWRSTDRGTLALIILLDQLTRNIHRGTARAYAGDVKARALADYGLAHGFDRALAPIERLFFYTPYEHAEDLAGQDRYIELGAKLGDGAAEFAWLAPLSVQSGHEHREIIARFGRFPHRNAVLGRPSTSAEREWLAAQGRNWGQAPREPD